MCRYKNNYVILVQLTGFARVRPPIPTHSTHHTTPKPNQPKNSPPTILIFFIYATNISKKYFQKKFPEKFPKKIKKSFKKWDPLLDALIPDQ
jgi:hypothetical protein